MQQAGAGIVYVSHRLDEIRAIADRVVCLRDGERVAAWDAPVSRQEMINAMVGRDFTFEHRAPQPCRDRPALEVSKLSRGTAFRDISFDVAQGEILGFAGLIGAGRTEVVRAIAGADRADAGEIRVDEKLVRISTPRGAMEAGIVMVPEDRKGQGLNLGRTAATNIVLPWEDKLGRFGMVTPGIVQQATEAQKRRSAEAAVRHPRPDRPAGPGGCRAGGSAGYCRATRRRRSG